jgi:hypothetical protein
VKDEDIVSGVVVVLLLGSLGCPGILFVIFALGVLGAGLGVEQGNEIGFALLIFIGLVAGLFLIVRKVIKG